MGKMNLKDIALALIVMTVCSGCWWRIDGGGPRIRGGGGPPHGNPGRGNK